MKKQANIKTTTKLKTELDIRLKYDVEGKNDVALGCKDCIERDKQISNQKNHYET